MLLTSSAKYSRLILCRCFSEIFVAIVMVAIPNPDMKLIMTVMRKMSAGIYTSL